MELPLLPLLAVLASAFLAGKLAERIGYPSVLGELMAGILLGPPLLGLLTSHPALDVLAQLGILLMMLYVGMEIDPSELGRASKGGILAALGGFITPFVLAYWVVTSWGGTNMEGLFVGMAAGVTSLATKSRILVDLKLLDTRIAHVMMAGALIADTLSLVIFAGLISVANPEDGGSLWLVAGKVVLFFGGTWAVGTYLLPRFAPALQRLGPAGVFPVVILVLLLFSEAAHLAGAHGILGAFIAGMFLRENVIGYAVSRDIMTWVQRGAVGFLAPIFFVTAGFQVDLAVLVDSTWLVVVVVGVATVGKIVGTALFYLPTGHGWREGLVLGAGMNGRGAVEIIIAQIGLAAGIISQEMFSVLVVMAIATTATVPVLLKLGVAWLRRRGELVTARESRKGAIIVNGGPINRLLGTLLAESMPVTIVDTRPDHCEAAGEAGLAAVQGSALDDITLTEAGGRQAAYILAHTGNSGIDALVGRLARQEFRIPHVHLLFDDSRMNAVAHQEAKAHVFGETSFNGSVRLDDWDRQVLEGTAAVRDVAFRGHVPAGVLAVRRSGTVIPVHAGFEYHPDDTLIILDT